MATENYFDKYAHLTGPPSTVHRFSKTLQDAVASVVELEDVSKANKELDEKEMALAAKQEQLQKDQVEKEIQCRSEMNKIRATRVNLDIGGHVYATSIMTLFRDPQSMLAAMFKGRDFMKTQQDGSYFFDRDGTHFRYILNYLRDGGFKDGTLPSDILTELLTEAEYYQLSGLVDLLQRILSEDLSDNAYKSVALKSTIEGFSKTLQETVGGVVELEEMVKDVSETKKELDEKETELEAKQQQLQKEKDQLQNEIQNEKDQLQKEKDQLQKEIQKERDQLQKEKDQLQKEIQLMSEMNKMQDSCIKLNIGGHIYTTSTLTLTKDPQSMLAAMFSGRHSVKKEEDGSYFIDRDGTHFRYILNYLRDGGFKDDMLPSDSDTRKEILMEAEYYQLSGLVALLRHD